MLITYLMLYALPLFIFVSILSILFGVFYYIRYRKLIDLEIHTGQEELQVQANQIADLLYDRELLEEKFREVKEKNEKRHALISHLRDSKEDEVESLLKLIDEQGSIDEIDISDFI